jgi:uncharacterized damage-inducible protein DinB
MCASLPFDLNWMKRFSLLRGFRTLEQPVFSPKHSWSDSLIGGVEDYLEKRRALDGHIVSFASEFTGEDLEKNLKYANWRGEAHDRQVGGLLLHVFNHQTHHRGMISIYLEILGYQNDFSSLVPFV